MKTGRIITINVKIDPRIYLKQTGLPESNMASSIEASLAQHRLLAEKFQEKLAPLNCKEIELDMVGTNLNWKFQIIKCCFWQRWRVRRIANRFRRQYLKEYNAILMRELKKAGKSSADLQQIDWSKRLCDFLE